MALHKNKETVMLMVITRDPNTWYVKVIDENDNIHGISGTQVGSDASFYYLRDMDELSENLKLKIYSYENELLYKE